MVVTLDLAGEPTPSLPDLAPLAGPAGRRRHTPRAHVVAVVLARDGADRLPRVLAALATQTRRPDALAGADLGSLDDSAALLAAAGGGLAMLRLPRAATAADAVDAVLALRSSAALTHGGPGGPLPGSAGSTGTDVAAPAPAAVEWLWLLPHDAAPAHDALEQLLLAVETAPSVGVAGCKQVGWDDDQRLLDVGFTASPLGLRVTGVDRDEVDQGQHDGRSDVLAVSGAGMLVRRDVWDALQGLDPGLDPGPAWAASDLDLCRRAHLAGYRVVVVPAAVVARAGRRPPRRAARSAVLHLRLAATPWPLLPLAIVAVALAAPLRAALLLAAGNGAAAADELAATAGTLARPLAWRRTRRRSRAARQVPGTVLRRLRPTSGLLARQRYDAARAWLAPASSTEGSAAAATGAVAGAGRATAAAAVPAILAAAAGLALERDLALGRSGPVGPWLLPAPDSAARLWAAATTTWRNVGLGARAEADPFTGLLAALGAVVGDPDRAVRLLLLGALPLAALAGWTAAAAFTRSRALRWWAALAWAAAPPLLAAVADGRPAAVLAHVLLPLTAAALAPAAGLTSTRRPLAAVARLGLLLVALLAAAPALAAPVCAVLVGAGLVGRRPARLALAAGVPALVLLPWWVAVARTPRLLLADPALAAAAAPGPGAGPVDAGRLWAALGWWPALAALAPLALAALGGPLRRRAGGVALLAWWAVAAGLAGAAAALAVSVVRIQGAAAGGVPGPCLSLALAGLGAAGLIGAQALAGTGRAAGRRRAARLAVAFAAVPALAAPAAVLAAAPVLAPAPRTAAAATLPAVAAAEGLSPAATRTLVVAVDAHPPGDPRIRWALAAGSGPVVGDSSAALAARPGDAGAGDAAVVLPILGQLLSGGGRDQRAALADLAVGSVVLLTPADAGAVLALDAAPGLTRLGDTRGALLWRVEPPTGSALARPARAVLIGPDGSAEQALPFAADAVHTRLRPGAAGRRVVLAERYDPGRRATLDGAVLTPSVEHGWAQGFVLPADGGRLEVTRADGRLALTLPGRGAALALTLLFALPLPRRRGRWAAPPPPRPSRPVPRPAPAPDDLRPAAGPRVYDDDEHPEDAARPLYLGPPLRRLRRRRLLRRALRRVLRRRGRPA